MFYDAFIAICQNAGTTPVKVRKALEISQSTVASWKSRKLTPNTATLQKIADYFGVSIENLLNLDPESPAWQKFSSESAESALNRRLKVNYEALNLDGKKKVADFAEDLADLPKYQRTPPQDSGESTPPAPEGTTPDAPETPPEGE